MTITIKDEILAIILDQLRQDIRTAEREYRDMLRANEAHKLGVAPRWFRDMLDHIGDLRVAVMELEAGSTEDPV